ncbi:MAG: hypothetical protein CML13_04935 [Puniceicoccaceae bacterium]|nr:hypothetical protein [Puniceicoccaceae bacterium]|tara:strand:+ start:209 stop:1951 length:1743 start_codon:yes stop_codon:yes gene_type:complete
MEKSQKTIPSVAELSPHKFFVPAYQRGYRWSPKDVQALLSDVAGFSPEAIPGTDEKTWYCLQPLVLKLRDEDGSYEVIDGQQRLTTIFLINRYINEEWRGKQKDPEFSLNYQSRKDTEDFLKGLGASLELNDSNIDFHYISKAYRAIDDWVKAQTDFKRDSFIPVFRHHVKVIWYDAKDSDSIESFTRLNMGKIPLTNAELIKALFLNSSNYGALSGSPAEEEKIRLKQLEISREWDRMENALHEPAFWYFLTDTKLQRQTRIDLVFEVLTQTKEISESDPYAMFREYSASFREILKDEDKQVKIETQWREVVRCFQILGEWYEDRDTYHKIGYLIAVGSSPILLELFQQAKGMKKSEFMNYLDRRICLTLPDSLDDLAYKNKFVPRVLLLHNIQTMLNNREELSRFPFDRFKQDKWDVEHIFSQNEDPPEQPLHRREWLTDALRYVTCEKLKQQIDKILKSDLKSEDPFKTLYDSILEHFADGAQKEEINALSNLALLDAGTNRGYGNVIFPVKRATIIERERAGTFVPVCTKNVFMKFYSTQIERFTFWSTDDQEAYFADIVKVLNAYKAYDQEGATQ